MITGKTYKLTLAGFLITLCGSILFSTKAIIIKKAFADTHTDALTLLTLRMVFSLPFYLLAAFVVSSKANNTRMSTRQWAIVMALGFTGYYLSSLCDFIGLQYISAGLERLILFLYPTFAVFINVLLYGQKINRGQRWALLLTYVGIGIAYFGELHVDRENPNFLWGSFMVFLCAITYAIYLVGTGKIIPAVGAAKFTAYAMLSATIGVFVHYLLAGNISQLTTHNEVWIYGVLLAIFATVIPSFLLSHGLKTIGSNNVAIISCVGPVSTIVQAHFILGDRMFAAQVWGGLLVVTGVLLIGWQSRPASQKV